MLPQVRRSVTGPNGRPDFLHEAPNRFACAAFGKESRMRFANAINLDRKSGGIEGHPSSEVGRVPSSTAADPELS